MYKKIVSVVMALVIMVSLASISFAEEHEYRSRLFNTYINHLRDIGNDIITVSIYTGNPISVEAYKRYSDIIIAESINEAEKSNALSANDLFYIHLGLGGLQDTAIMEMEKQNKNHPDTPSDWTKYTGLKFSEQLENKVYLAYPDVIVK